jgi:predicted phosphodiesterase
VRRAPNPPCPSRASDRRPGIHHLKLAIYSDLHLGGTTFEPPRVAADAVILAGDIARPAQAMAWARALARPVVYVAGNHEFYDGTLTGTVDSLQTLARDTDVHFLERSEIVLGGVRFLGATLWTDFRLDQDQATRDRAVTAAARFMRDFQVIHADTGALFTPADAAAIHRDTVTWLATRLATPHAGPTVVVTHHAPSPRSIHPRFAGSPVNAAFVSDLEHLLDGRRAVLWVHGHTHDSFDYVVNGTRVVCNPRGYTRAGRIENAAFDPALVLELQ